MNLPKNEKENEEEKEEFIQYLEQYNILEKITNVFIMLYTEPERPSDPIDYVRKHLCPDNPDVRETIKIQSLIEEAVNKLADIRNVRDKLLAELNQLENGEELLKDVETESLQNEFKEDMCTN